MLTFVYWVILHEFLYLLNIFISKKYFKNYIRVSNSFDPDQSQHFVGSDLAPSHF